jgi:hypothetical protein
MVLLGTIVRINTGALKVGFTTLLDTVRFTGIKVSTLGINMVVPFIDTGHIYIVLQT